MLVQILLDLIGFSGGCIVAGGVVALMVGLGIITRFIGISHTAKRIMYYEDAILLGTIAGTLVTVFEVRLVLGIWILLLAGLFMGIFVGGWIMALAEVIHVFPVYCRRLGLTQGLSWVILSVAAGKVLGSLLFFHKKLG